MRLIDADAIPYKRDIVVTERLPRFGGFNGKIVYSVTKEEIDAMPTVDAVPCDVCRFAGRLNGGTEGTVNS